MFRDAGCFTVLAFGYENVLPVLAHQHGNLKAEQTMEIIRRAPDFAVINNVTHDVQLIEVKYRKSASPFWVLQDAERMYGSWKPSYLFVATSKGFYFDKVAEIVKNKGKIPPFQHPNIPDATQAKYVSLLNEFFEKENVTLLS